MVNVFVKKLRKCSRLTQKFLKSGKMKQLDVVTMCVPHQVIFFAFLYIFQVIFKSQKAAFDPKAPKTAIFKAFSMNRNDHFHVERLKETLFGLQKWISEIKLHLTIYFVEFYRQDFKVRPKSDTL